jgi:geranylgeranyl pyrophosphate synthase
MLGNGTWKQINALGKFAESIGIAFQIQDDILNITNDKWGKDFGEDITEGKKSLIVIKTFEQANEIDKKRLVEILNLKTKDKELIKEAIEIIKKYSGIKDSKKVAEELVSKAWKEIDSELPDSDSKNKLKLFADFMIERDI